MNLDFTCNFLFYLTQVQHRCSTVDGFEIFSGASLLSEVQFLRSHMISDQSKLLTTIVFIQLMKYT